MATVSIVLGKHDTGMKGAASGLPSAKAVAWQAITSSGTSQQSAAAAIADDASAGLHFWAITVVGGPVWIKIGTDPTAAAGDQWLIPDGATREFAAKTGQKVAVIDA